MESAHFLTLHNEFENGVSSSVSGLFVFVEDDAD
jgi:hypothetical protein